MQTKRNRRRQILHHILQHPQLRSVAILQEHFEPAIVIEIGERERSAVFDEVHAHRGRDVGKCSIPIVGIENISLVTAPGAVRTDQFVDGIPSLLVFVRRRGFVGRISHDLPPEKTVQILARRARDHSVGDIEIGKTVMIEIECVARPRPAAHSGA